MKKKTNLFKIFPFVIVPLLGISILAPLVLTSCKQNVQHIDEGDDNDDQSTPQPEPNDEGDDNDDQSTPQPEPNDEGDDNDDQPAPQPEPNSTNYIGNICGTDWKGYESGSLVCEAYDSDSNEINDSVAIISNNDYIANNLVIPDYVQIEENIYPLKQIKEKAFSKYEENNCEIYGILTLNNETISIDKHAFANQQQIREIKFGKKLEMIGKEAFSYLNVENISFPALLKKISEFAFFTCSNLKFISFSEGLEEIGESAFEECYSITQPLIIPESVKSIKRYAFCDAKSLGEIRIKESTILEEYAFNEDVTIIRY